MLNQFAYQINQSRIEMSGMTVSQKLRYLEKNTKLFNILNNDSKIKEAFTKLTDLAENFNISTSDFFTATALHTDTDAYTHRGEKVSLMTMHAAKGLEFPVVFIAGCEENLIPLKRPDIEPADIREERRLFYVAMTRAMDSLYLTLAKKRRIYGKLESRVLSPFVADIEKRLKKDERPRMKKKKGGQVQLKLF
jgi:superfamily I DNA/RNA helicase